MWQIWAVLDPLSRSAQRTAPLLEFLERTLQPTILVHPRLLGTIGCSGELVSQDVVAPHCPLEAQEGAGAACRLPFCPPTL